MTIILWKGRIGISSSDLVGFWEHRDGSEGGELTFVRRADNNLQLEDCDGLPLAYVFAALRNAEFVVPSSYCPIHITYFTYDVA